MDLGLLPDPGDQEDVVVDAQGDQEHEDDQRKPWIDASEVEHMAEHQDADPERRTEGQHHRCDEQQRAGQRAEQQGEDGEDHQQHHRMITRESWAAAFFTSRVTAEPPPSLADAPWMWCTAARARLTVSRAFALPGPSLNVADTKAEPPSTTGSATSATPAVPASAALIWLARDALPTT